MAGLDGNGVPPIPLLPTPPSRSHRPFPCPYLRGFPYSRVVELDELFNP